MRARTYLFGSRKYVMYCALILQNILAERKQARSIQFVHRPSKLKLTMKIRDLIETYDDLEVKFMVTVRFAYTQYGDE